MQQKLEKVQFDLGQNLGDLYGSYMLPEAPIESLGFLFTDAAKKSAKIPSQLDVYAVVSQIDSIVRNELDWINNSVFDPKNNQAPEYFIQPQMESKINYFIKKPSIDEVFYYSTTYIDKQKQYTASHKNLFASTHSTIEREVRRNWDLLKEYI